MDISSDTIIKLIESCPSLGHLYLSCVLKNETIDNLKNYFFPNNFRFCKCYYLAIEII